MPTPHRPDVPISPELLAQVMALLNDKPRFGPRNRRHIFDSYSVASEISGVMRRAGYDPQDPALLGAE